MFGKSVFDAEKEIPDLSGKVIFITGGTSGLGRESVLSFAAHNPAHIYFSGRSQSSADKLMRKVNTKFATIPITFIKCDLASLESVKGTASKLLAETGRLDIFMANAGVLALRPGLTQDGYEIQFGTNHLGHALLAKLLIPLMETSAKKYGDARIVWSSSEAFVAHPRRGILFDELKTNQANISLVGGPWMRYGQSKLANLLYARSVAKHHPSITSVSVHPGVSATAMVNNLSFINKLMIYVHNFGRMLTPEQCAGNQQWAATAALGTGKRQVETGTYYKPVGVKGWLVRQSGNDKLAERLWDWTQEELERYL